MPENLSNICSLREGNITETSLWRLEWEIFLILPRLILFLFTTKVTKINLIIIHCKVRERGGRQIRVCFDTESRFEKNNRINRVGGKCYS